MVIGNSDNVSAVTVAPSVSAALLGEVFELGSTATVADTSFLVTDLWGGGAAKTMSATALEALTVAIGPDLTPGGGLGLLGVRLAERV